MGLAYTEAVAATLDRQEWSAAQCWLHQGQGHIWHSKFMTWWVKPNTSQI